MEVTQFHFNFKGRKTDLLWLQYSNNIQSTKSILKLKSLNTAIFFKINKLYIMSCFFTQSYT